MSSGIHFDGSHDALNPLTLSAEEGAIHLVGSPNDLEENSVFGVAQRQWALFHSGANTANTSSVPSRASAYQSSLHHSSRPFPRTHISPASSPSSVSDPFFVSATLPCSPVSDSYVWHIDSSPANSNTASPVSIDPVVAYHLSSKTDAAPLNSPRLTSGVDSVDSNPLTRHCSSSQTTTISPCHSQVLPPLAEERGFPPTPLTSSSKQLGQGYRFGHFSSCQSICDPTMKLTEENQRFDSCLPPQHLDAAQMGVNQQYMMDDVFVQTPYPSPVVIPQQSLFGLTPGNDNRQNSDVPVDCSPGSMAYQNYPIAYLAYLQQGGAPAGTIPSNAYFSKTSNVPKQHLPRPELLQFIQNQDAMIVRDSPTTVTAVPGFVSDPDLGGRTQRRISESHNHQKRVYSLHRQDDSSNLNGSSQNWRHHRYNGQPDFEINEEDIPRDVRSSLMIFYVPKCWTLDRLRTTFEPFGQVLQYRLDVAPESGTYRGRGFVQFDCPEAANRALQAVDGMPVEEGRRLKVQMKKFLPNRFRQDMHQQDHTRHQSGLIYSNQTPSDLPSMDQFRLDSQNPSPLPPLDADNLREFQPWAVMGRESFDIISAAISTTLSLDKDSPTVDFLCDSPGGNSTPLHEQGSPLSSELPSDHSHISTDFTINDHKLSDSITFHQGLSPNERRRASDRLPDPQLLIPALQTLLHNSMIESAKTAPVTPHAGLSRSPSEPSSTPIGSYPQMIYQATNSSTPISHPLSSSSTRNNRYSHSSQQTVSRVSPIIPENNLFVFHIPPDWNETEFRDHFSPFGPIRCLSFPKDRSTPWGHRGYGFVCYDHHEHARRAIIEMDGKEIELGRRLKVEFKKPINQRLRQPPAQNTSIKMNAPMHPYRNQLNHQVSYNNQEDASTAAAMAIMMAQEQTRLDMQQRGLRDEQWCGSNPPSFPVESETPDRWPSITPEGLDRLIQPTHSPICQPYDEFEEHSDQLFRKTRRLSSLHSACFFDSMTGNDLRQKPIVGLHDLDLFPCLGEALTSKPSSMISKLPSYGSIQRRSQRERLGKSSGDSTTLNCDTIDWVGS